MRIIQTVVLLAFLAMIGLFALQNRDVVTISFLSWSLTAPIALLTLAVYVLGMLSGWTVTALVTRSIRRAVNHPDS